MYAMIRCESVRSHRALFFIRWGRSSLLGVVLGQPHEGKILTRLLHEGKILLSI